jgi:hypothetical protein
MASLRSFALASVLTLLPCAIGLSAFFSLCSATCLNQRCSDDGLTCSGRLGGISDAETHGEQHYHCAEQTPSLPLVANDGGFRDRLLAGRRTVREARPMTVQLGTVVATRAAGGRALEGVLTFHFLGGERVKAPRSKPSKNCTPISTPSSTTILKQRGGIGGHGTCFGRIPWRLRMVREGQNRRGEPDHPRPISCVAVGGRRSSFAGSRGQTLTCAVKPSEFFLVLDGRQRLQTMLLAFGCEATGLTLLDKHWKEALEGKTPLFWAQCPQATGPKAHFT